MANCFSSWTMQLRITAYCRRVIPYRITGAKNEHCRPKRSTTRDVAGSVWHNITNLARRGLADGRANMAWTNYDDLSTCLACSVVAAGCRTQIWRTKRRTRHFSGEEWAAAAFRAAFCRFVALRGSYTNVYCDNGTNFVGEEREMRAQCTLKSQ